METVWCNHFEWQAMSLSIRDAWFTQRVRAESEANRFLWPGFSTFFPDSQPVREADDMSVGYISILPLEEELLTLWEGGSAWTLDPGTLATKGKKRNTGHLERAVSAPGKKVPVSGSLLSHLMLLDWDQINLIGELELVHHRNGQRHVQATGVANQANLES